uniref:Mediator of RNA polymerase II transcription subunit 23 n=1 Tax=Mesocestoides corti TaxID=53468 RepID=A0A5K3ERT0_MESCO
MYPTSNPVLCIQFPLEIQQESCRGRWPKTTARSHCSPVFPYCRVFDEFVLKYVNNEAKLLMAFSLITPPMKALNTDNSTKVVDLTVSLYKAVQQVDEALAAKNVPMYHVNTIADLLYHIKYTFVGNAVKEKVQGLLGQMRPRLQACLKFVFPTPITTNTSPTLPPGNANDSAPHNPVLFPVFEEREYRAALRPPACLGDDFF